MRTKSSKMNETGSLLCSLFARTESLR